jgi:hypothetical protein
MSYAVGLCIFGRLGRGVGGALLIAIAVALAIAFAIFGLRQRGLRANERKRLACYASA